MGKFVKTLVATTSISLILATVPTNVFANGLEGGGPPVEDGMPEKKEERNYVIHHYLCGTETKVADDDKGKIEVGKKIDGS